MRRSLSTLRRALLSSSRGWTHFYGGFCFRVFCSVMAGETTNLKLCSQLFTVFYIKIFFVQLHIHTPHISGSVFFLFNIRSKIHAFLFLVVRMTKTAFDAQRSRKLAHHTIHL